ncbi:MAG: hypothetical protein IJG31_05555, partial [Fusobacterium sp.]|nr:hypothetical protein [Fusobacterium sp.]
GEQAFSKTENSIVLGTEAKTSSVSTHTNAVAIGNKAAAEHGSTIAIGNTAKATALQATAIGSKSEVSGDNSVAIGQEANSTGTRAVSLGVLTKSTADRTIAIGNASEARASDSMAIGSVAIANGGNSIALGNSANAIGNDSIVLGASSTSNSTSNIAIGDNVRVTGEYSLAIGSGTNVTRENSIAIGRNSNVSNQGAVAIGLGSETTGERAITIGTTAITGGAVTKASAKATDSVAIGNGAVAEAGNSLVLGLRANATSGATNGVALGTNSKVEGNQALAIGSFANAKAIDSIAIGTNAVANLQNSVAIGNYSVTTSGTKETTGKVGEITYGNFAGALTNTNNVVSVGGGRLVPTRQIKNVAAGKVSSDSTDAINGSQLYATNNVIGNMAEALKTQVLGGNAEYEKAGDTAGKFTYTNIGETGKDNIHDAILASRDIVAAGTNIKDIKATTAGNGQVTYTVNAKGAEVALKDGEKNLSLTPNTDETTNITKYTIGLSATPTFETVNATNMTVTNVGDTDNSVTNKKYVDDKVGAVTLNTVGTTGEGSVNLAAQKLSVTTNTTGDIKANTVANNQGIVINIDSSKLSNTSLSNITNEGETVIKNLAKATVDVKGTGIVSVDKKDVNGVDTYTVSADTSNLVDTNLTNITEEGNKVIHNVAKDSVKVKEGSNTHVKTTTETGTNGDVNVYTVHSDKSTTTVNGSDLSLKTTTETDNETGVVTTNYELSLSEDTKKQLVKEESVEAGESGNVTVKEDGTNTTGGKKFVVDMSKTLNVDSVTINNGPVINKDGIDMNNTKITNVADPTNATDATNKQYVDSGRAKVTSDNQSVTVKHDTNTNTYDLSVDTSSIANTTKLTYKANGGNAQTTTLAKGLNFVNGDKTVATVDAAGVVKYDLNDETKTKIDSSMSSFKIQANNEAEEEITNGNTITFANGDNIEITRTGKTITVGTSDTLEATNMYVTNVGNTDNSVTNKKYVDDKVGAVTLNTAGTTGEGSVKLATQTLSVTAKATGDIEASTEAKDQGIVINIDSTVIDKKITENITNITNNKNEINKLGENTIKLSSDSGNTETQNLSKDGGLNFKIAGVDGVTTTASGDTVTVKLNYDKVAENTPLTYKANGGNAQTTTLAEGLNFVNGKNTTATVGANGEVKIDAIDKSAKVIAGTGLSVTPGTETADGDTLVTGYTVALSDEIKNKIDNSMSSFKIKANSEAEETVSNGETVTFVNGDNIEITRTGKTITVGTSKDITATTVNATNMTVTNVGDTDNSVTNKKYVDDKVGAVTLNTAGTTGEGSV